MYNLLHIYSTLLFILCEQLEYRILIVAKEHSAVLLLGEWLKLAMHPLKWFHIYAPVVPQHLALELLQCPAPYLLGILRESLDTALTPLPAGVLLVDLDCDIVTAVPADLQAALSAAESLIDQLAVVLKPNLSSCDDLKPNGGMPDLSNPLAPDGPAELCRRFVRTLLQPVEKCFVVLDDSSEEMVVALDEDLFVRKVCAADNGSNQEHNVNVGALEMLARQLMRSQSFSEHLLTLAREFKDAHGSNM